MDIYFPRSFQNHQNDFNSSSGNINVCLWGTPLLAYQSSAWEFSVDFSMRRAAHARGNQEFIILHLIRCHFPTPLGGGLNLGEIRHLS